VFGNSAVRMRSAISQTIIRHILHTYCVGADLSYNQDSSELEVWAMPFNTESNL
jgi:hypothetical protein